MDSGPLPGLLLLVGIIAIAIFMGRHSSQKHEQARTRAIEEMRPYHEAFAKAVSVTDPQLVVKTGSGLVDAARYWQPGNVGSVAEVVYRDALNLLKSHPDIKPFALSVGRIAYGAKRPDRQVTVYDEQAIMNDIGAHS
jgi:hypothetical protein